MASPVLWIAGPIQYWDGSYTAFNLAWDFIGGNGDGEIRRWRLRYQAEFRRFVVTALKADKGDQSHATALTLMYRQVSICRKDLPKGKIDLALRAMLSPADTTHAVRLSLKRK